MSLKESEKRNFSAMLIIIIEQKAELLDEKGYDSTNIISKILKKSVETNHKKYEMLLMQL